MIPLDRVRAMLAAATPGPWEVDADGCLDVTAESVRHRSYVDTLASVSRDHDSGDRADANAALIAAAPDLAAQVLALTDALATAERDRDEARAALAAERERCAQVCEARAKRHEEWIALDLSRAGYDGADESRRDQAEATACASAIRNGGSKE